MSLSNSLQRDNIVFAYTNIESTYFREYPEKSYEDPTDWKSQKRVNKNKK